MLGYNEFTAVLRIHPNTRLDVCTICKYEHYLAQPTLHPPKPAHDLHTFVSSIILKLSTSDAMSDIDTLIVVACHAIYNDGPTRGMDETEWLIEPFQQGETPTFIEHIQRGLGEVAKTKGRGLLAFSGGATKRLKTGGRVMRTEAHGYAVSILLSWSSLN